MGRSRPQLDRFVAAVHRRWVLLRVVESAGIGLVAGSVAGLLLVPLLLWRASDVAFTFAAVLLVTGAAAGALVGWTQRPTRLQAAVEADRQLGLADLVGSAWLLRGGPHDLDPWDRAVLAVAEARCGELSTSALVLRRMTTRAWGAIGLVAALVLTLGLLSAGPEATVVRATDETDAVRAPGDVPSRHRRETGTTAGIAGVAPQPTIDSAPEPSPHLPSDAGAHASGFTHDAAAGASSAQGADGEGRGSGSAQHDDRSPSRRPEITATSREDASGQPDGGAAGAGGTAAVTGDDRSDPAGATSGARADGETAPPWDARSWQADRERAREAIDRGAVPDAYRDVVREYFE